MTSVNSTLLYTDWTTRADNSYILLQIVHICKQVPGTAVNQASANILTDLARPWFGTLSNYLLSQFTQFSSYCSEHHTF